MITIKNIFTTFSTLENGCRVFFVAFLFHFWLTVNGLCNKKEKEGVHGEEVEKKELYISGT